MMTKVENVIFEDFIKHENQNYPHAISQNVAISFRAKSQLMTILEADSNMTDIKPATCTIIIDGATLAKCKPQGHLKHLMNMQKRL